MSRIIGLIFLIFSTVNIFAQDILQKNVPAVVLNTFLLKFPNANDVDWRLEKGNYQVKFEVNNKDNKLLLDHRGKMLKHEQDLYVSEIPKNILKTIESKVPFFDIYDADRIEEGNKIIYIINFEIHGKDHDFRINDNGKLLKYRKELKNNDVPTEITSLIKSKYGVLEIDRADYNEEEGEIIYYLKGEINDKDHEFIFQNKTRIQLHKQDLNDNEIPAPVLSTLRTRYSGFEIRDADLREENGKTTYTIQLRKSKEQKHVILNPEGKILEVKK